MTFSEIGNHYNPLELKELGIDTKQPVYVDTIEELRQYPPFFVSAHTLDKITLMIDETKFEIDKNKNVILPIGIYSSAKKTHDSKKKVLRPAKTPFSRLFKRYNGENLDNKRILIIRNGGFGDLLFLQPVLNYIKSNYKNTFITFCASINYSKIFNFFPKGLIDNLVYIPFDSSILSDHDYHFIYEGLIERCAEAKKENCYDLMTRFSHIDIDHSKELYRSILDVSSANENEISTILPSKEYIVIQMRATSMIRMMPESNWVPIIKELSTKYNIILLDHPRYLHAYDRFINESKFDKNSVLNLTGYCNNIGFALYIISKSKAVIGVDSAYIHIGDSFNKPVLGIYGAFKADLRMRYYRKRDWIETKSNCEKQPCFLHQMDMHTCSYYAKGEYPICMQVIDPNVVLEKFNKLIGD